MPTKIEWATDTWNPITGCTPISEGCQNCYAKRMSKRLAGRCGYDKNEPFKVTLHKNRLDEPLHWKKPSKIFVCSMGDLFHEGISDMAIEDVFATMSMCPQHTFLLLTKRPDRVLHWFSHFRADFPTETVRAQVWRSRWSIYKTQKHFEWPLPNVWLGVTAENQQRADERIPILLQIPAAVRFVSVEPMLGPVDLTQITLGSNGHGLRFVHNALTGWSTGYHEDTRKQKLSRNDEYSRLDWVICGGETGPGARPMHPDWVRSLRDQCQAAGTPFFFKSWGNYCAPSQMPESTYRAWDYLYGTETCWREDYPTPWKVGKKKAGRLLDGQVWEQWP